MFCKNCGSKLEDGTKFCPQCGTPAGGEITPYKNNMTSPDWRNIVNGGIGKINSIISKISQAIPENIRQKISAKTLCYASVVVVMAIIVIFMLSGRSYKSVVDSYVKGSMTGDSSLIWELFPDNIQEAALEEEGWEEDEAIEYMNDILQSYIDKLDAQLGENWSYSYEITSEEDYSSEELNDCIENWINQGVEDFKADAGKYIEIKLTISADPSLNKEPSSGSLTVGVVKIGRSWYLADFDF